MHVRRHSILAPLAVGLLACNFAGSPGEGSIDAAVSSGDAAIDAEGECTSGATHLDTCALPEPSGGLRIDADARYDTDLGMFTVGGFTDPVTVVVAQSMGEELRVIVVDTLRIESNFRLRAVGSLPLVIVSISHVDIDGTLAVGNLGVLPGAGSNSALCGTGTGTSGDDVGPGGGPGGGGGGFGSPGGAGAIGDNNGGNFPGAVRGEAALAPTTIRGGCAGGAGGFSDDANSGAGGAGGGAVEVISFTRIRIPGIVTVGGGGGGGGPMGGRGGGGGGGSGGYIGLEAPMIEIDGIAAANGGGGGEGADTTSTTPSGDGEVGRGAVTAADGGTGGAPAGGEGGPGGALNSETGATGDDDVAGGGGGGGGTGYILVFTSYYDESGGASSPAAVQVMP